MKLFVWEGPGVLENADSGMICVLAHDLEEALRLIGKEIHWKGAFPLDQYRVVESPEAFICWGSE